MATSPLYNWPEPDNTDLVKNGALAIRTLGNAIDTTMGTMVAKTVVDAKGDLIAGTAADTVNRLAVGNNGETLVADSSTSTGLRYQAPVAANPVLNSAFQIWQRGTSLATGTTGQSYQADRWNGFRSTTGATVSRQVTNDTTNLPFIQYCARVQRDSGNTAVNAIILSNNFETINSIPYAGKTVTLSFYARAGANFSATSSLLSAQLITGTGTDQNWITGYTGQAVPINQNVTLTTTWQRFSVTATIATTATEMAIDFNYAPTGTAGANDWFEVTGVQLEVGSVATPFKTYGGTIQGELAACQRYYEKSYNQATAPAQGASTSNVQPIGVAYTTGVVRVGNVLFKVTKRTAPVVTLYNTNVIANGANWAYYAGGWGTPTSTSAATILQTGFLVDISKTSTFTAQNAYMTDGDWAADAEL
jgi:hypothetical protein